METMKWPLLISMMCLINLTDASKEPHPWKKRLLSPKSSKSSKQHRSSIPYDLFHEEGNAGIEHPPSPVSPLVESSSGKEEQPAKPMTAPVPSPEYSKPKKKKKKNYSPTSDRPVPPETPPLISFDETESPSSQRETATKSPTATPSVTPLLPSPTSLVPVPLPVTTASPTVKLFEPTFPILVSGPTIILSPTIFTPPTITIAPTTKDSALLGTTAPTFSETFVLVPPTQNPTTSEPSTNFGNLISAPPTQEPTKTHLASLVTSTPTVPDLVAPIAEQTENCVLVGGDYGKPFGDTEQDIEFLYEVETSTPTSGPGTSFSRKLEVVENAMTTSLLPLIFPETCGSGIGSNNRHLSASTIVGISSRPQDMVVVDKVCQPSVFTNMCFVVDGRFRVFSDGQEPAHLIPVVKAKLRTEIIRGNFDDVVDGIVRVSTHQEKIPIDSSSNIGDESNEKPQNKNKSMIGAMVGVFGTGALLLGILARRHWGIERSQKQGEAMIRQDDSP